MITYEKANDLLLYDKLSGDLSWKVNRGSAKAGDIIRCKHHTGYLIVRLFGKNYSAHLICWLLANKRFPETEIDHVNRKKDDNRLSNLRLATRSENCFNKEKVHGFSSKHKGVFFSKDKNKWRSGIKINQKNIFLGYFDSENDAAIAYNLALKKFDLNTAIRNAI